MDAVRDLRATVDAYRGMARASDPELLAPNLARVACPVLLLLGGAPHAGGPPERELAILRNELPSFRAMVVENAGHYVHEEQPKAVAAALRALESDMMMAQAAESSR
jgi:pimeloyl-ACP methyl ester carboxylesterase